MLRESYPYYLAGTAVAANTDLPVTNKYTGAVATRVARADRTVVAGAIGAAQQAFSATRRMPAFERQAVLQHVVERVTQRQPELAEALAIEAGDPLDEQTFLGPLITEADALRIEQWVREAVAAGARVLCGGRRNGAFYEATYLENVDPRQKISCIEVFGPVAAIQPFDEFAEAIRIANDSHYGLQCGFSRRIWRTRSTPTKNSTSAA